MAWLVFPGLTCTLSRIKWLMKMNKRPHGVSPISFINDRSPWTKCSASELLICALSFRSAPLIETKIIHIQSSFTNKTVSKRWNECMYVCMYVFCIEERWPAQKTPGTRLLKITTRTPASWRKPDTSSRIYREKCEAASGRNIDKNWELEPRETEESARAKEHHKSFLFLSFFLLHIWIYCCQKMNYSFLRVLPDFGRKKKF